MAGLLATIFTGDDEHAMQQRNASFGAALLKSYEQHWTKSKHNTHAVLPHARAAEANFTALASTALHHSKDVLQYQTSVMHNLPEIVLQSEQLSAQIDQLYTKCSTLSHLLSQLQQQRDNHALQTFQQSPLPPMLARPLHDLSAALDAEYKTAVQKSADGLKKAHQAAFQARMTQFQERLSRGSVSKSPTSFDISDERAQPAISDQDLDAFYSESTHTPPIEPVDAVSSMGTIGEPKPSIESLFQKVQVNTELEVPSEAAKQEIEHEEASLP